MNSSSPTPDASHLDSGLPRTEPAGGAPSQTGTAAESTPCTLPATSDNAALVQPVAFGPYDLLSVIARGDMGVVYKARHRTLGRLVAVKTMRQEALGDAEHAQRFEREMRATASLNHPHIVPIYDVGQESGLPFYAMALIGGGSLAQQRPVLQQDARAAVQVVQKIARALQYAHDRGVVHRDLKPGNILLDENGERFISDFGLAKVRDGRV